MAAEGVDLCIGGGEIEESGDQYDRHAAIFNAGGGNEEDAAALHHQALVSDAKRSEVDKDDGVKSSSTSTCVAGEVQRAEMNKAAVTARVSGLAEAAQFTAVNSSFTARATTSEESTLMATIAELGAKIADLAESALFAAVDSLETASAIISEQSERLARIADLEKLEETINDLGKTYTSIANFDAKIRGLQSLRHTIGDLEAMIPIIENARRAILPDLEAKFDDDLENLKARISLTGASVDDLEATITAIQAKLKEATESRAKIGNQKKSYNNIAGEPWAVTAVVGLLSAVSAFAAYYLRAKRRV